MTDLTPRAQVRAFLQRLVPLNTIAELNKMHGLELKPGDTFQTALNAIVIKKAIDGDQEAAALVKRYGIK